MAVTRRSGQFFIIGALLIASMIAAVAMTGSSGVFGPDTDTPRQLFDQALDEFPRAVNTITAENTSTQHMQRELATYLGFQQRAFAEHGLQSRTHALVIIPRDGGTVDVVFANFRQAPADDVAVTVNGVERSLGTVAAQETRTATVPGVAGDRFPVQLQFTADRRINRTMIGYTTRRAGLYGGTVRGERQTWRNHRTY